LEEKLKYWEHRFDWLTSLTIFAIIDDFPVPDSPSKTQGEFVGDVIYVLIFKLQTKSYAFFFTESIFFTCSTISNRGKYRSINKLH